MKNVCLVLFGILAASQARPETGYNYPKQRLPLQLNQIQSSTSYQQAFPQISQAPQLVTLNQHHQSSSYQESSPQFSSQSSNQYNLPSLPAPAISQAPLPQASSATYNAPSLPQIPIQQVTFNQAYQSYPYQQIPYVPQPITLSQSSSYQQNVPPVALSGIPSISATPNVQLSVPQTSFPTAQTAQFVPQGPQIGVSLDVPQNIPQPPNFQSQVLQQNSFPSQDLPSIVNQPSFNQIPESLPQVQQQSLPSIATQTSFNQLPESLPQQPVVSHITPQSVALPAPASLITKYIYVHVAPEEPLAPAQVIPPPPPPRKSYKIIFIKTPSQSHHHRQIVHVPAAQPAVEEKTLVYVLVDKPQQPEIVVPPLAPTQPSKPEVYFIKYKASNVALPAPVAPVAPAAPIEDLGTSNGGPVPVVVDLKKEENQQQPFSSGESTSSLFSGGGLNTQYGPPGYQKRNA